MMRLLLTLVSVLCVCACATADNPVASTAPIPADASQSEPADGAEQEAGSSQTSEESVIHVVKLPPAEQNETPIAASTSNANERVCRREMRTGTHRAVRVCRTRAEMMRLEEESKDTFRELHRSQMQGE